MKSETESDTEFGSVTSIGRTREPDPLVVDAILVPRLHDFSFAMGGRETILDLKKRMTKMDSCPVERMIVRVDGTEMSDEKTLLQCGAGASSDRFQVSIDFVGPERPVEVLVIYGREWTRVVVDESDTVRDRLPRVPDEMGFKHPPCFFCIHYEGRLRKRAVMDDARTFRWHRVVKGDEIELFPGRVITAHLASQLKYV